MASNHQLHNLVLLTSFIKSYAETRCVGAINSCMYFSSELRCTPAFIAFCLTLIVHDRNFATWLWYWSYFKASFRRNLDQIFLADFKGNCNPNLFLIVTPRLTPQLLASQQNRKKPEYLSDPPCCASYDLDPISHLRPHQAPHHDPPWPPPPGVDWWSPPVRGCFFLFLDQFHTPRTAQFRFAKGDPFLGASGAQRVAPGGHGSRSPDTDRILSRGGGVHCVPCADLPVLLHLVLTQEAPLPWKWTTPSHPQGIAEVVWPVFFPCRHRQIFVRPAARRLDGAKYDPDGPPVRRAAAFFQPAQCFPPPSWMGSLAPVLSPPPIVTSPKG